MYWYCEINIVVVSGYRFYHLKSKFFSRRVKQKPKKATGLLGFVLLKKNYTTLKFISFSINIINEIPITLPWKTESSRSHVRFPLSGYSQPPFTGVPGAKRGGEGGRKNAQKIPLSFFLPPYPLPLSTPATQARLKEGSMKIALYFRIRVFAKCAVLASFGC